MVELIFCSFCEIYKKYNDAHVAKIKGYSVERRTLDCVYVEKGI